jgi:hypothetical protein
MRVWVHELYQGTHLLCVTPCFEYAMQWQRKSWGSWAKATKINCRVVRVTIDSEDE